MEADELTYCWGIITPNQEAYVGPHKCDNLMDLLCIYHNHRICPIADGHFWATVKKDNVVELVNLYELYKIHKEEIENSQCAD